MSLTDIFASKAFVAFVDKIPKDVAGGLACSAGGALAGGALGLAVSTATATTPAAAAGAGAFALGAGGSIVHTLDLCRRYNNSDYGLKSPFLAIGLTAYNLPFRPRGLVQLN